MKYLEQIGFLGSNVLATHVTYTDEADWDAIARTGTNVVHTAYRKAKEGLTSPFWEYLEQGTNVCMATDSFSHDLVENLKLSALLGKVRERSVSRPTAEQVLRCATHGAGRALARPELGVIEPGALGDVLVLDMTSPFNSPVFDPLRAAVYYGNAGSVRHSLVDGRPVHAERAGRRGRRRRCPRAVRSRLPTALGTCVRRRGTAGGNLLPLRRARVHTLNQTGRARCCSRGTRTALVVVDMQNGFCHSEGSFAKLGLDVSGLTTAIDGCVRLVDAAREHEVPLVFTRYVYRKDYRDGGVLIQELMPALRDVRSLEVDTWDAELVDELQPAPDDFVLDKNRYSAFYGTGLEPILTSLRVDTLVLCGVTTNMCVETTDDAMQRDYRTFVVGDATGELDQQRHEMALATLGFGFGRVVHIEDVLRAWATEPFQVA